MGPVAEDAVASMSMTSWEADGAAPSGVEARVSQPAEAPKARGRTIAAVQLGAAALAVGTSAAVVLAAAGSSQAPPEVKAPAMAAARAVAPLVPAESFSESLAGPPPAVDGLDSRTILRNLLRKAGLRANADPRRLTWDQARRLNAAMPTAQAAPDAAQPFILDTASKNGREALRCLTQAAYYEAGANGPDAEAAVVQVVLNRVRHPDFPKSVCGVVYEGSERDSGCQFTFTCDGAMHRPIDLAAWNEARKVAERALSGYVVKAVGASTYYHADYVFPTWAPTLQKMAVVGPHIFYRMAGPEGAAAFLTGHYAGGELKLAKAILRATDRFTQKPDRPGRDDKAQVMLAQAHAAPVPAGLKAQADRLRRVHDVLMASAAPAAPAKVETASVQPTAAAPAPAAASDAPTASTVSAPVAQTADASAGA